MYDVAIIGAGPAGISALLYSVARGQKCIIYEAADIGGLIQRVSKVSHFAGLLPVETGQTFADRLERQLKETGSDVVREPVIEVLKAEAGYVIKSKTDSQIAKAVIFATGSTPKPLGLANEKKLGVRSRIGNVEELQGREVFVAGGSDGAAKEALAIAQVAKKVHMVQIADKLLTIHEFKEQILKQDNLEVHLNAEITELGGTTDTITRVVIQTPDGSQNFETDPDTPFAVFAYIGQAPNADLLQDFQGVEFDKLGYIVAPENGKLPVPGLYVAGDIRAKGVRQIATAVADGCLAAIAAYNDQH